MASNSAWPAVVRLDAAHPAVGSVGLDRDQALLLQGPEQPAEVAGVEAQPGSQRADVARPSSPDLPQHPGRGQRPAPGEVLVVEHADALGHRAG